MSARQLSPQLLTSLSLHSERLGPLPLVNHFTARLGLEALLDRFVPTSDPRVRLPYALGLGVLLRSILVEREPVYRQQETVSTFAPSAFGLTPALHEHLSDDAVGRALDHFFDADRSALLTEIVVAVSQRFGVGLDELHNDSTSIRFCGQYRGARGRSIRGRRAPFITYGHSKDHRPDLKQLLFILTTSRDGGVPVQFRCEAGNASDSRTHEETWDTLCRATGRRDFLYVADSKLCSREAMDHIDRGGGRFVCVMPRSRSEDAEFRDWVQTHEPQWELVWDRPNPRQQGGPRDRWWTFRSSLPSREAWPVIWVKSSLLAARQEASRRERIAAADEALAELAARLAGPRPRLRSQGEIQEHVDQLTRAHHVHRYLLVTLDRGEDHRFRQAGPGRPGPHTRYIRKTRTFWQPTWTIDEAAVAYDRKSDGMYPLLSNDRGLTNAQALAAHKGQPSLEKRFEQTKTVHQVAPVLLKNEGRIEALFFLYFLALLVQALTERELRLAMRREELEHLPLYPEERTSDRPTTEQVFRLFAHVERHVLAHGEQVLRTFEPELTELQGQILSLLGVPVDAYRNAGQRM